MICYSLAHEADSLAFHVGPRQVQNYETIEIEEVVSALNKAPEMIVVTSASSLDELRARLPAGVKLIERGQYEHIVVGVCTVTPNVADRR